VDPRLRAAVDTSLAWYEDVFALHGIQTRHEAGLWWALGPPPPWHSGVKTTEPGVEVARVLAVHRHGAVADSFGDLDLRPHGFEVLVDATWVHHPPLRLSLDESSDRTHAWSVVREPGLLAEWNRAHDYAAVLLPAVLDRPAFSVLARRSGGALVGGAVLHRPAGSAQVVGLSNTWTEERDVVDHADLLAVIRALDPGAGVTAYAWAAELDAMVGAGYAALGPQRVWLRGKQ
jgi:hypothetical protein